MSEASEAILSFTIKINAKLDESTKQTLKEMKDQQMSGIMTTAEKTPKDKDEFIGKGTLGNFRKDPFFKEQVEQEQLKADVVEALNKLDHKALGTLSQVVNNPTNAAFNALSKLLTVAGPEGQILMGIIVAAITLPEVIGAIVKALSAKGFPLNRDWHRFIQKEIDVGLTRELQKKLELGIDRTIFSQFGSQFIPNNPHWTTDSYLHVNESRLRRIGLTDRASGAVIQ